MRLCCSPSFPAPHQSKRWQISIKYKQEAATAPPCLLKTGVKGKRVGERDSGIERKMERDKNREGEREGEKETEVERDENRGRKKGKERE